jgi:hypothetical protein
MGSGKKSPFQQGISKRATARGLGIGRTSVHRLASGNRAAVSPIAGRAMSPNAVDRGPIEPKPAPAENDVLGHATPR